MESPVRVLVVADDDPGRAQILATLLADGVDVWPVDDLTGLQLYLPDFDADVIVASVELLPIDGFAVLNWVRSEHAHRPVVLIGRSPTMESTVRAIHGGAHDLLRWPGRPEALLTAVRRAARQRRSESTPLMHPEVDDGTALIGSSAEMVDVYRQIARAAKSHAPVLIMGESGTGKELVAHAVHAHSSRGAQPIVAVNCGALSETLLESELFGHVRGAFTGADRARTGLFAAADGGVLFLDEIGEISPRLQVRLLRALQSGEIRPVGSDEVRRVDVRIVAATHRDLAADVATGRFRQDLYYRLNVMPIRIAPLRDRPEDLGPLIDRFFRRSGRALAVSEAALDALQAYAWPGNVRELENVVARAAVSTPGPLVTLDDLPPEVRGTAAAASTDNGVVRTLAEVERDYVERILSRCTGNKSRAARMLGIDRKTLGRILAR
jgi:DNA-binding NtrC family response regulator